MNDAGRIGFVLKGDYNAATTYEFLDVVHYGHNSYAAKGTTTGNLPTDTTYWQPITDGEFLTATDYATASVAGIVKPDGSTTEVGSNGVFSAKGITITATVNPSGTTYSANWLMVDGAVITPEADKLYKVTVGGSTSLYFWNGSAYEMTAGGSAAGVSSFNGRMGAVLPVAGDYTPDQVGAAGVVSSIEIDGTASLPYDFDYYDGGHPGNYFRVSGSAMSNSPTGMESLPFKMTVEQIKDLSDLNTQCKQTVIFCNSRDDDTEAHEFFRYGKIVVTWQDQEHTIGSGNLEFTDWKEAGEGGGHEIVNSAGAVMAQRNQMKFANATVADDSVNDQTIITVPSMVAATSGAAGAAGLVPAPAAGDQGKVLSGAGIWVPPTNPDMISDAYSASKAYAVGDYCIYNNTLYKALQAQLAGEDYPPTNASYWEVAHVGDELVGLNSRLVNQELANNEIAYPYDEKYDLVFQEAQIQASNCIIQIVSRSNVDYILLHCDKVKTNSAGYGGVGIAFVKTTDKTASNYESGNFTPTTTSNTAGFLGGATYRNNIRIDMSQYANVSSETFPYIAFAMRTNAWGQKGIFEGYVRIHHTATF